MSKTNAFFGYSALLASAMTMALVGCQETTNEDLNSHKESEVQHEAKHHEHAGHSDADHTEDNHAEHDEHMENEAHDHEKHAHDEHAHDHSHGHAGHNHDSNRIKFECEPKVELGAFYHADSTPKTAHLLIDGIEYDLTAIDNDSAQNTYVTNVGFDEAHGLVWQVNDDKGVLSEIAVAKVSDNANLKDSKILHECHKAS